MFDVIAQMLSYPFLTRALIVGTLVALSAALLGVNLVFKRYSMIGDGLSHVGFGSLSIAKAFGWAPLAVSIPVVILATFLLLRLSERSKIKGDAAVALISTGSLAVGVMVISLTTGMNVDVCNYMFGSILAMSRTDVYISVAMSLAVMALYLVFYGQIFAVTFDEGFARATGAKAGLYNMLLALLTAVTVVVGMRLMGALLISSLVIFPALTAMRLMRSYRSVIACSAALSVGCFLVGMAISYLAATPAGASVVTANMIAFGFFSAIAFVRERRRR